jgi:hypothetical protein
MWRDLERMCEAEDLPFRRPSRFPRNGAKAAAKSAKTGTETDAKRPAGISMVGLELLIGQVRGLRGSALASLDGQRLVALVYLAARKASPWVASLF